jgi:hypothetical protein
MAGYRLDLRAAPDQPDPARLVLDLHVEAPEVGATVMTTSQLAWEGDAPAEVVVVDVRARGATGGAVVPVTGAAT